MYYTDNDFRLYHSWGTSPKQKAREKEYNAWYYQHNKEKWKKYAENARRAAGNIAGEITGANARDRMLAERRHVSIADQSVRKNKYYAQAYENRKTARTNYNAAFNAWYNHPVVRAQRAIQRGKNILNGIIRGAKTAVRNVANRAEWAGRKAVNTVRNYSATVQAANDRKKRLNSSGSQALRSQTNAYNTTRPLNRNRG